MFVKESLWFAREIERLNDDQLYPMLNIGSQSAEFRKREQPWIDRHLFEPARIKGAHVVHSDLQYLPGVDLVGDLTDASFLDRIRSMHFRSVFCSNLLEHVPNPAEIASALVECVDPGGLILASCPNVFPFHPDPIDTMYRPTPEELAALFPSTTAVALSRLRCGNLLTYLGSRLRYDPLTLLRMLIRRTPQAVSSTDAGMSAREWLPWCWQSFYQSCVILRRNTEDAQR